MLALSVPVAGVSDVVSNTSLPPVNRAGFSAVSVTVATEDVGGTPFFNWLDGMVTV